MLILIPAETEAKSQFCHSPGLCFICFSLSHTPTHLATPLLSHAPATSLIGCIHKKPPVSQSTLAGSSSFDHSWLLAPVSSSILCLCYHWTFWFTWLFVSWYMDWDFSIYDWFLRFLLCLMPALCLVLFPMLRFHACVLFSQNNGKLITVVLWYSNYLYYL